MADILTVLTLAFKIIMLILDKTVKTATEERRKALSDLDSAIELAKQKKDMTEISKWLGERL